MVSKVTTRVRMLSFGTDTAPVVLPLVYCPADDTCSKSAQKSAVQICQVTTVVMETTRLVISQFKNFIVVNAELNKVSLCQKLLASVANW